GTGEAEGENRAVQAAEKAIANPLLDEISLNGAKGVLINITGGTDLTLFELDEAANIIRDKVDGDANIIVGSTLDPDMQGAIRVSVVATGIDVAIEEAAPPAPRRRVETAPPTQYAPEPQAQADDLPPRRVAPHAAAPRAEAPRVEQTADDMPAPAYQPRETPRAPAGMLSDDAENFIAPRSAAPRGTPPADVMERMRRAAAAQPGAAGRAPAAPAPRKPEPQPAASRAESRRTGLSRMIERMAGHSAPADKPSAASLADRVNDHLAARRHGNLDADFDDLADDSPSENSEIPAFLRRQAN
ncbi:MAG: cell division protein FtsZ, partial [Paracoccus sp. (in: a-proteobacteria)]|nr:cell division protein FtsZ [Paracoccus sp. (in: a-proteobacteria)]